MVRRRLAHHYHVLENKCSRFQDVQVLFINDYASDTLIVKFGRNDFRVTQNLSNGFCTYTYNMFSKPDVCRSKHGFSADNLVRVMSKEISRRLKVGGWL